MNQKNNRRYTETQDKIRYTFLSLLKKKPVNKITVREVCQNASINRSTFYAHFTDVFQLFNHIKRDKERCIQAILYDEDNKSGWGLPNHAFRALFEFVQNNQEFYRTCIEHGDIFNVLDFPLFISYENQLKPLFLRAGIFSEIEADYRLKSCLGSLNAMIRHWLNRGCQEDSVLLEKFFYMNFLQIDL